MAAFLTANRWSSGIGTHKTKEGRILCTGCGCIGCFPETNQTEADELGICDVDLTGHPFRTFLNEEPCVAKHKSAGKPRKGKVRLKQQGRGRKYSNSKIDFNQNYTGGNSISPRDDMEKSLRQAGTQTKITSAVVTTHKTEIDDSSKSNSQLSEKAKRVIKSMKGELIFEDQNQASIGRPVLLEMCELDSTMGDECVNPVDKQQLPNNNTSFRNVHIDEIVNTSEQIHDNLYVLSKKDTALNYHENIVPKSDNDQTWKSSPWELGEDAVCFYFVLEYYNSQRVLPRFKVLEIVEALCEVVDARDIKCVQRVSGIWQIVLRTRKYQWSLRTLGIKLRGRSYELIDDVQSYCDIVSD